MGLTGLVVVAVGVAEAGVDVDGELGVLGLDLLHLLDLGVDRRRPVRLEDQVPGKKRQRFGGGAAAGRG